MGIGRPTAAKRLQLRRRRAIQRFEPVAVDRDIIQQQHRFGILVGLIPGLSRLHQVEIVQQANPVFGTDLGVLVALTQHTPVRKPMEFVSDFPHGLPSSSRRRQRAPSPLPALIACRRRDG